MSFHIEIGFEDHYHCDDYDYQISNVFIQLFQQKLDFVVFKLETLKYRITTNNETVAIINDI